MQLKFPFHINVTTYGGKKKRQLKQDLLIIFTAENRAVNLLDINFCKKESLGRSARLLIVKNRPKISGNVTFTKNFLLQDIS